MVDKLQTGQEFISLQTFGSVVDHIAHAGLGVGGVDRKSMSIKSEYSDGDQAIVVAQDPEKLKSSGGNTIYVFNGESPNPIARLKLGSGAWHLKVDRLDHLKQASQLGVGIIGKFGIKLDLEVGKIVQTEWY